MIDYERYCQIRDHLRRKGLNVAQTAQALGVDARTVAKWAKVQQWRPRAGAPRPSKLDAYKGQIVRWLDTHPYSAQQILQRLREVGFTGGATIVKAYVARIRPRARPAYLKLEFAPGECAQVDWGSFGTIGVGRTRRRLSFFVMVLCYSRRMYLEFTVAQTSEFFLACHEHAFAAFGGVPAKVMVDNLRSAVLRHLAGCAPVFNPRYADFARHWGFEIVACNPRAGNEKGRVENAVGYIKKNLLAGLELPDFAALQPVAQAWVDTVADVRLHAATHERPIDRFAQEASKLGALNPNGYDLSQIRQVRASPTCRVPFDSNHYTVPPHLVGCDLTLKAWPDRICIYHDQQLVARHPRSFERHCDIEDPDHVRLLQARRAGAREQRLMVQFLALSPRASQYAQGLEAKRANARSHIRRIVALAEIYGREALARAIDDAIDLQAYSAEYLANILAARQRSLPEPAALQLTRRADLLDLQMPEPDLSVYDRQQGLDDANPKLPKP